MARKLQGAELLSTPLHGVFIPAVLLIVGAGIMDRGFIIYGVIAALLLAAFKFYRGRSMTVLRQDKNTEFEVEDVIPINHNTVLLQFKLPKDNDRLGVAVGQSIRVTAAIGGQLMWGDYTPLSCTSEGSFEILVKRYPGEPMSNHICNLRQYQVIRAKGPIGDWLYTPNAYPKLTMIAGGTGITPMFQIIDAIVKNPNDSTKMNLIFANDTEEDILLKDDIDALAAKYPYFDVHYVVRTPKDASDGSYSTGLITSDIIKSHVPSDSMVLISGPPPMIESLTPMLKDYNTYYFDSIPAQVIED
ncbi:NADH-cytochrome b5 reductase 1 [Trichomonascus vanleenenianus]|uniref:cytochrome b5 reductase family protein n=1 Tax=Trichomonascus vanleenenianus TaxID=2268995 RepID=UPI003ECB36C7